MAAGDYVLNSGNGTLEITENMTINGAGAGAGAGATTIDGDGNQVFRVSGPDPSSVTLSGMNVQGSTNNDNDGGGIGFEPGNTGTLNISHVVFTDNSTDDVPGGAIYFANDSSAGAALNITDSTIAGNAITCCENGAGIAFENGGAGTVTIDGSTLSGNTAATNGPGSGDGGAVYFDGATMTITNSTISGNSAAQGAGLDLTAGATTLLNDTIADNSLSPAGVSTGAGIFGAARVSATNTIVSGNTGATAGTNDCDADIATSDHSLENGTDCGFDDEGDPMLEPLANNGGPTQTMALAVGSAAIDAGATAQCPATDQRGFTRPDVPGTACDVGAYESGGPPTASITAPANGATFTMGQVVDASYACTPGTDGTLKQGSAGCAGPVASGAAIDTSTVGPHSFTVAATDTDGQTGSATSNYTVVAAAKTGPPVNIVPPSISGAPTAHSKLSCSTGTWSNSPTSFAYQWSRNGTPSVGATGPTYTVQTSDEGLTLTCTVTASNAAGAGSPATSTGVAVPVPVVARCPAATGQLSGQTLGLVRLGMTRSQARRAFSHSSARGKRFEDFFCLTPIGVRVGYASPKLLDTVPSGERKRLHGRVVWASTANAFYSLDGIRPGATLTAASTHLKLGRPLHIGLNFWYLAPNGSTTAVLKVRHGIVEEIGIGDKQLTQGRKDQRRFMKSFF